MTDTKRRLAAALGLLAALGVNAAPARAEKVPSAEQGVIALAIDLSGAGPAGRVFTARAGEMLVTALARPADAVRLDSDVWRRVRPSVGAAIPAGTMLFGVELSTGTAYCPPLDLEDPVPRVQCLRDFDADGDFDAGYLGEARGLDTRYGAALLRGLGPAGLITYAPADAATMPAVPVRVEVADVDAGGAAFRLWVEEEEIDELRRCGFGAEPCNLFGADFALVSDGAGGVSATRLDDRTESRLSIRFTGIMRRR